MHFAVTKKNPTLLKLLLDKGDNPDIGMIENLTPLNLAAAAGWIEGIHILVASRASIDSKDSFLPETPLHKAARNCNFEAYHILIRNGANLQERNIDDQDCKSILDCARESPDDWRLNPGKIAFLT